MEGKDEYIVNDEKKESKKRGILKAALIEFSEKGYEKAVLDDIASKAGVAKGTLYLYYKDKKDLFNQSILFVIDSIIDLINDIAESNLSPTEKIKSVIRDQVKYFLNNSHLFNIFQMAFQENLITSNKEIFNQLIERKYKVINILNGVVNEAKKAGEIKENFPTDDIITVCDGVVTSLLKAVRIRELNFEVKDEFERDKYHRLDDSNIEKKLENSIKIIFEGILKQAH